MIKLLIILFSLIPQAFAVTINLKPFEFDDIEILERASIYFSNSSVRTVRSTKLDYRFILMPENVENVKILIDKIITFSDKKIEYTYPLNEDFIDLTPLMKQVFHQVDFTKAPVVNSFNCHNLSLVLAGFQNRQSYTSRTEINFYMNNFCKEISEPARKSISVYNHPFLSHSVTTIDETLLIEKPSVHIKKHYRLKTDIIDGFKHFKRNGFKHYQCDVEKFKSLKCNQLNKGKEKLELVDMYFTKLAVSLIGAGEIDNQFLDLQSIEDNLVEFLPRNKACKLIKQSMLQRINSLSSFYEDLKAGNLYGVGSYGGSGPRV
jgi:hypothetical protein